MSLYGVCDAQMTINLKTDESRFDIENWVLFLQYKVILHKFFKCYTINRMFTIFKLSISCILLIIHELSGASQ